MRMDLGRQADGIMNMRAAVLTDGKVASERYDVLKRDAL